MTQPQRLTVREKRCLDNSSHEFSGSLQHLINTAHHFSAHVDNVPAEDVLVSLDANLVYGEWMPVLVLEWDRPETDSEYNIRVGQQAREVVSVEIAERKELSRLIAKYGVPSSSAQPSSAAKRENV